MSEAHTDRKRTVAVVGLGYVGISLSTVLAERGCRVYGVDVDEETVEAVEDGTCPIGEQGITNRFESLAGEAGRIRATTEYDVVSDCDTVIVTVGTPMAERDPDLTAVETAAEQLGSHLTPGQLVVFRSTIPPKTTTDVIRPILASQSGLDPGADFHLAFCPERMAESSAYDDLTTVPVVVGGIDDGSTERAIQFWEGVGLETIRVSNPTAAELTKLADNWWIDLNIALANELALLSEVVGVDAMEVIRAANTLPKGEHHVNILFPGIGVGGSCLVKDPWFVARFGEDHGVELETPRISRSVNEEMPAHFVERLSQRVGTVEGKRIAVLGYAFKADTDDPRNTPVREVIEALSSRGGDVRINDPYVPPIQIESETSIEPTSLEDTLAGADIVAIGTAHERYRALSGRDLQELVGTDQFVIVDGRRAFSRSDFDGTEIEYLAIGDGMTTDD